MPLVNVCETNCCNLCYTKIRID
uniref:Uncharacterized protein n=1 Tax=Anguilla anguilla TaxID=7936 RepID=A0A0E9RPZ9_ANGAN